MQYPDFNEEDFAADEFFQQWVLQPTSEDERFWQTWLTEYPDKRPTVQKARWLVQHISFNETWTLAERTEMWTAIQATQLAEGSEKGRIVQLWNQPAWGSLRWLAAACVTLLLVSLGLFYVATPQNHEIKTAFGKKQQVTLADGSVVTLNANSTLHFADDFASQSSREVWIEGEAFFDVAKHRVNGMAVPFVVHANNLSIKVLGTAFNVTNRRNKVDVALEHGSVKVVDELNTQNAILLEPGEKVSQLAQKAPFVKQAIQIDDYTAWKDNLVLFKQKSLSELAEMMKDLYNIDVVIDNPALQDERFSGSFPADSVNVFFRKLQKMHPIAIKKEGKVFHLK